MVERALTTTDQAGAVAVVTEPPAAGADPVAVLPAEATGELAGALVRRHWAVGLGGLGSAGR